MFPIFKPTFPRLFLSIFVLLRVFVLNLVVPLMLSDDCSLYMNVLLFLFSLIKMEIPISNRFYLSPFLSEIKSLNCFALPWFISLLSVFVLLRFPHRIQLSSLFFSVCSLLSLAHASSCPLLSFAFPHSSWLLCILPSWLSLFPTLLNLPSFSPTLSHFSYTSIPPFS